MLALGRLAVPSPSGCLASRLGACLSAPPPAAVLYACAGRGDGTDGEAASALFAPGACLPKNVVPLRCTADAPVRARVACVALDDDDNDAAAAVARAAAGVAPGGRVLLFAEDPNVLGHAIGAARGAALALLSRPEVLNTHFCALLGAA